MPIAFKDLQPAVGFPFTRGSTIYRNAMPAEDSVLVERLRQAGAIPIGKTNTPELGMGSHTYNKVYGTTVNPYDPTKSAGGSSGGAAAALATGMLPIADGSDMGGSLRNPGNFNNVVGMRPTVGLVPTAPTALPFVGFSVNGPLARTVSDTAWLLSVMAGPDPRDPACVPSDPATFRAPLDRSFRGTRVAWCPDLGGLPLDARVRAVLSAQRKTFEALGCVVEDIAPDLAGADSIFLTIRAFRTAATYGSLLATNRDQLKIEAVGEIEAGLALTSTDVAEAMVQHGQLLERVRRFQEQVRVHSLRGEPGAPFDATLDWPKTIDGVDDGALRRVDEVGLLDHRDVPAGDVGPGRVHAGRTAGRPADRRPVPRGFRRAAAGVRVRAGHAVWEQAASDRDEDDMKRLGTGQAILLGWMLCGVLDITAACVQSWIQAGRTPWYVLKGVASALWGRAAIDAGPGMAAIGLTMHFTVALTWTLIFFALSRRVAALRTAPLWIVGPTLRRDRVLRHELRHAARVVLAAQLVPAHAAALARHDDVRQLWIHMACVGTPIAWGVRRAG